jgi:glutathione S-transferase
MGGDFPILLWTSLKDWRNVQSIAIIQYLIEKYDTTGRLTYTTGPEKYLVNQWLLFQASGQGVYFGQGNSRDLFDLCWVEADEWNSAVWFSHVHAEKLPSVISRYRKEIRRVLGVLDAALEGKRFLVGDKVTIADLSFVPWHSVIPVRSNKPKLLPSLEVE